MCDGDSASESDSDEQAIMWNPSQLNRGELANLDGFQLVECEGIHLGMGVRIEIESVPCELFSNFDPANPIVLRGVQAGEDHTGLDTLLHLL